MYRLKADITEVFSSIQGEGIFLGAQQVFVRFKGCNLKCVFCDEQKDQKSRQYSPFELMKEIKILEFSKRPHHSVSLTGGEPLLHADFLQALLRLLKREGLKSYLETNGTLPEELSRVIDFVDIIAMDFKLPSSTGQREFWNEHFEFLKIAVKKKVFVKAVITPATVSADIEKAISLIKKISKDVPLILQPATPLGGRDRGVDKNKLLEFLELGAKNGIEGIRAIPQVHKILDVK